MTNKSAGAAYIMAERNRQIEKEGWTPEHDDQWKDGELSRAAICYVMWDIVKDSMIVKARETIQLWWPWDWEWWKPKSQRGNLIRAGALIAAEIDRLNRLSSTKPNIA